MLFMGLLWVDILHTLVSITHYNIVAYGFDLL